MAKYTLLFKGGYAKPEEEEAHNKEWGVWMGGLGEKAVDGLPFGNGKKTVKGPENHVTNGGEYTGYIIVNADSIDDAVEIAKSAPHQKLGGTTEVYETMEM